MREEMEVIEGEVVEESKPLTPRQQFAADLHAMADFMEQNEGVPLPNLMVKVDLYNLAPDQVPAIAKAFGSAKKEYIGDSFFVLKREFWKLVSIEANWTREQVCTKVVVGQKTVARQVPVAYELKNVTEDVIEWRCSDPILAPRKVTAALPNGQPESDVPF